MRKWALIIAIIGLGALLLMLFSEPKEIKSLDNVKTGALVSLKGKVSEEKELSFGKTFLVSNISAFCECKEKYSDKEISAIGIVEDYYELRVRILKISVNN